MIDKWIAEVTECDLSLIHIFPTIKSKKDSLYITLFFLFSIACIAGLRYEQRFEMQKGCLLYTSGV